MTSSRLASFFNEAVQWDALFIYDDVISHLLDEAIRLSRVRVMLSKEATEVTRAITRSWIQQYGPMRYLISDSDSALTSHVDAVWADRHSIQLRTRPSGAHAPMVE